MKENVYLERSIIENGERGTFLRMLGANGNVLVEIRTGDKIDRGKF